MEGRSLYKNCYLSIKKVGVHPEKVGVHPEKVGVHPEKVGVHPEKVGVHPEKVGVHTKKPLKIKVLAVSKYIKVLNI